jgi:hypothetical protein
MPTEELEGLTISGFIGTEDELSGSLRQNRLLSTRKTPHSYPTVQLIAETDRISPSTL